MNRESEIRKLERGRAEFAYRCVEEVIELRSLNNLGFVEKVVENFKNKVFEELKKEIEKGSIKKERIEEILSFPRKIEEKRLNDHEKKVFEKYKKYKENYSSYTKKLPTMILSNGLGQTLAFVKSKAKDGNAYELLYAQMSEYMKSNSVIRIQMPPDKNELIEWVISCNSKEYRWITQELLAFLNWLKRFTEGMIEEEGE
ncbi:type III-B CRISPR module-associated protein Cmr5 [Thermodesulfovibrio sp. TK110]